MGPGERGRGAPPAALAQARGRLCLPPPTLLSERASLFASLTQRHPQSSCSQPHLVTSEGLGLPLQRLPSYLPANVYGFQNFPQRREEAASIFLTASSPVQGTPFPLCWSLPKGTHHIGVGAA